MTKPRTRIETATRTTYKARDWVKEELVKKLEDDHEPVDPSLRDADAPITKAQVERFFALKYPQYEPLHDLDPLFTDERFFTALENNIHWRDHGVTVDLRPFYNPDQVPPAPGATVGLSGAVTGSGN